MGSYHRQKNRQVFQEEKMKKTFSKWLVSLFSLVMMTASTSIWVLASEAEKAERAFLGNGKIYLILLVAADLLLTLFLTRNRQR